MKALKKYKQKLKTKKEASINMMSAMYHGWAYELVPSSDEAILAIDEELEQI